MRGGGKTRPMGGSDVAPAEGRFSRSVEVAEEVRRLMAAQNWKLV
jgi:hypothetical protein